MRKILSIVLVLVLLASAVPLAVTPVAAYEWKIPCDDGDNELTKDELVNAILPYMLDEGDLKLDDVGDASYVYAYWDGEPKTFKGDYGEDQTMYRPPERVVAAYPHSYLSLQIIKATDNVVGIGHAGFAKSPLFPEFAGLPVVGFYGNLNYEALLKLQPDLVFVIVPGEYWPSGYEKIKQLDPSIAVACLWFIKSHDRAIHVSNMRTLGDILDRKEEAKEFIDYYEGFMDMLAEKVDKTEEDKPRVYCMSLPGYYGWKEYKKGDTKLIEAAGGNDIFSDVKGSAVSVEEVIKRDPEVIICQEFDAGGYDTDDITKLKEVRDKIMNLPELQNVTAVKTGRVYTMSTDLICCGATGGRHFLGIVYIAKCLYRDNIDLDPTALHQEFMTRFQAGSDYDLYNHGIFVYHPTEYPEGR